MPSYERNKKYAEKYLAKFDNITIRVQKGDKAKWLEAAKARGTSLNKLIVELMQKEIEKK